MNYEIVIEKASFKRELDMLKPQLVVVDENVGQLNCDYPIEYVAVSETNKCFEFYFQLLNLFHNYDLNRTDTVVFVGGGVLIDVASFAASTYKRGINYINVPTTTLSMIDSSVGSKNGLNYLGVKNLIGNITDPSRVIIDVDFLQTLDSRNYYNGIAEAIKVGYLSNGAIIDSLNTMPLNIEQVIKLSVAEKLRYVEADKQDLGYRNYLNFGHTFGHAIESITDFKQFYHGEAVALGMVIASGYDHALIDLLTKFKLPTKLPLNINIDELISLMTEDKKNTSDKIKVILKNPTKQIVELTTSQVKALFDCSLTIDNEVHTNKITVNKSKSYIHRLLASALVTKSKLSFEFDIANDLSDDVIQSVNIVKGCNGQVTTKDGYMYVDASNIVKPKSGFYVYKSATTYRIFAPILCSLFGQVTIKLDEQLASRPHDLFSEFVAGDVHNIKFDSDYYQLDGSISSQFISGYILAIVASNKSATIEIINQVTSAPYIDMTIEIINKFGYNITRIANLIEINKQLEVESEYQFIAEPDFSSLAYIIVFNKLAEIHNLGIRYDYVEYGQKSLQADSCILDILDSEVIDLSDCPDLLPTLVVYGLLNKRGLTLTNVDRIKFKECDRILAMITNYQDLNAISQEGSNLIIKPVEAISRRNIQTYGDHRIAMATSIIAPFCSGPIIIDDYTVVNKSFPTYFQQLRGE